MAETKSIEILYTFFARRHWLRESVLLAGEYEALKSRVALSPDRMSYLSAFCDGYLIAQP